MVVIAEWRTFDTQIPSGLAIDGDHMLVGLRAGTSADAREYGGTDILTLDSDGSTLHERKFAHVAEIHAMTRRDDVLTVTDRTTHTIQRYDLSGRLLGMIGRPGVPSDTGCCEPGGEVPRPAGPFNLPTKAIELPDGRMFVSDGYANARVHSFASSGDLTRTWGGYGGRLGEFRLPHSLLVDEDRHRVLVCDRNNNRIQAFAFDGESLGVWWETPIPTDIIACGNRVYVVDLTPQVAELTWDGDLVRHWPVPDSGHNIEVGPDGAIYICHIRGRSITKIIPTEEEDV
ncbi:NHL repeat-containing protein [Rhodococcus rhodochrous J38]|uniref:hypothetical protein n=1 Tax=Rhodococcus rhodochrous TaxID=1829 RepID=UPI00119D3A55|nr:hypothetical protein [Rhodococcus rhodochrous]TWH41963.1 NHL repeat-containing protein [Rhodococcus rhodochrous J38]